MIKVLGIKITDRIKEAGLTQHVLSKHAGVITTRFGFHELSTEICAREAYMILHLNGNEAGIEYLVKDLSAIGGIETREMDFSGKSKPAGRGSKGSLRILGMLVEHDHDLVTAVQRLLTTYGCVIRARLGVNEEFFGRPAGLIILELSGDAAQMDLLEKDILALKKVHLRKMIF
ncbi:MAG TPA: hypothetical protein VMT63_04365 [Bacteroidales bacterium]|nr:hypothetical protein [Bacteroidales bacterium]